jgi:hypothetical protein
MCGGGGYTTVISLSVRACTVAVLLLRKQISSTGRHPRDEEARSQNPQGCMAHLERRD